MTDKVVNALIVGVIGVVAYIAVKALITGASLEPCGDALTHPGCANNTTVAAVGDCGSVVCPWNATTGAANATANCSYGGTTYAMNETIDSGVVCWPGSECILMQTIVPLGIAIVAVVATLMGLTKLRA